MLCKNIHCVSFQQFNAFSQRDWRECIWADGKPVGMVMWGYPYSPPKPAGRSCMSVRNAFPLLKHQRDMYDCRLTDMVEAWNKSTIGE